MPDYRSVPFESSHEEEWDNFVDEIAINGTIWHSRRFLGYHPEGRFNDASILIYDGAKLVCVLPACRTESGFFSHTGSTAGGPVVHPDYYKTKRLLPLLDYVDSVFENQLGMRLAESVFSTVRVDPIVYHLGLQKKVIRELGVVRPLHSVSDFIGGVPRSSTRSAIRKELREGLVVDEAKAIEDYETFHSILVENLAKHDTTPTHTAEEVLELKERLGSDQVLLVGHREGDLLGGTWIMKASPMAWHTFYIAKREGSGFAVMPTILTEAMSRAAHSGAQYLNFGICTEERGNVANLGLFDFKESLGGRTISRFTLVPH